MHVVVYGGGGKRCDLKDRTIQETDQMYCNPLYNLQKADSTDVDSWHWKCLLSYDGGLNCIKLDIGHSVLTPVLNLD